MKKFLPVLMSLAAVVIGIVFIAVGIHTLSTKDLYDSTVNAVIVDYEEHWETDADNEQRLVTTYYIDYEVNGVKYEHVESPEQNMGMNVGDTVEILYQSQNPEKISAKNITSGGIIVIVVGALVAIGGCFSGIKFFIKMR